MMEGVMAGLVGSVGTVAFFAFVSFAVWIDYRKKKDERYFAHEERMKSLELGHPPPDAEIARARAYASASWAAGLIGLLVPVTVAALAVLGTIIAVLNQMPNLTAPLIVAWSIVGVIILVTVLRSLSVIRQLSRPTADAQPRPPAPGKRAESPSGEFHEKRMEL